MDGFLRSKTFPFSTSMQTQLKNFFLFVSPPQTTKDQRVCVCFSDQKKKKKKKKLARLNKEKGFPKWAVKLSAWMMTTYDEDSETCLRRDNCDPVGGKNVWGSFNPPSTFKKDKIVFVSASQDSNAFFHDLAPGAAANIADVAALVGAMEALRHVRSIIHSFFLSFDLFSCVVLISTDSSFHLMEIDRQKDIHQADRVWSVYWRVVGIHWVKGLC
jgi:hypothetical protein